MNDTQFYKKVLDELHELNRLEQEKMRMLDEDLAIRLYGIEKALAKISLMDSKEDEQDDYR